MARGSVNLADRVQAEDRIFRKNGKGILTFLIQCDIVSIGLKVIND
ncbi:MAG: hypothetical protein FWH37_01610 [Candidatus Bathyarchaeota archaeon]|nr:hypothetical protein [Candidatus Termiticorpusculum sp.]